MNNLKSGGIAVVVSVVVVSLGLFFYGGSTTTERVIEKENLGAIPGNNIEGKYIIIGGVELAYVSMPMIATSSVPCVTKNPFNATSTIIQFSAIFTDTVTDIAGVPAMDFSTSTNAYLNATSTTPLVANWPIKSNSSDEFLWRAQTVTGETHYTLRANHYIGLKNATTSPGVDTYTGYCTATFQKL